MALLSLVGGEVGELRNLEKEKYYAVYLLLN